MASGSLQQLLPWLSEIDALQSVQPSPTGAAPSNPDTTRAINRASIVLLNGHLERYLRSLNEEAADLVLQHAVSSDRLPVVLRLQHTRVLVDGIVPVQWDNREAKLVELFSSEPDLWRSGSPVSAITPEFLLRWMKSPNPKAIRRFFRLWGVDDIFHVIARKPTTRSEFELRLDELVSKRNAIAHGDPNVAATQRDILAYRQVVMRFCERGDRAMARSLQSGLAIPRPW